MLSGRPSNLLLAALLLCGCTNSFNDAGLPPSPVYAETQQHPTTLVPGNYPVTQNRNQTQSNPSDNIEVTDLQPVQPVQPLPNKVATAGTSSGNQVYSGGQIAVQQADVAALIQQSRANYSGNCPCPYDTDRAGHSCGFRSAYSRAGGASVLCYPSDVTAAKQAQPYAYKAPIAPCGGDSFGSIRAS